MKKLSKYILSKIKKDEVDWVKISSDYFLSESFIRQYQDKVSWHYISGSQELSEDFIREFKHKVIWSWISESQELSEDFIIEFQGKLYFLRLLEGQRLHNYSCKMQKLILEKTILEINKSEEYYFHYITDYMKELYEKLSIML